LRACCRANSGDRRLEIVRRIAAGRVRRDGIDRAAHRSALCAGKDRAEAGMKHYSAECAGRQRTRSTGPSGFRTATAGCPG
jgi:hypothetical protein